MHPDTKIQSDYMLLMYVLFITIVITTLFFAPLGMAPADECANNVINRLSPWRVVLVTKANNMPASYNHVKKWCKAHTTDYEHVIINAVNELEEEPKADMYLDIINRY